MHHLSIYPRDIHPGQTYGAKEYNLTTQRRSQLVRCNRKIVFEWQHLLYSFLKGHMTTPSDHVTRFPPSNRTWVENWNGSPSFVKDSVSHPFASSRNLTALWILMADRKRAVRRMARIHEVVEKLMKWKKKWVDSFNYQPVLIDKQGELIVYNVTLQLISLSVKHKK